MNANELRDLLLSPKPFTEKHPHLPNDAVAIAFSARIGKAVESADRSKWARRAVIALFFVGVLIEGRSAVFSPVLLAFAVLWYEISYSAADKVRAELIDAQARERARRSVDEYLKSRFPDFVPPKDEESVFSVCPEPHNG